VARETLQATSLRAFSLQKFLNTIVLGTVFMIEGRRVLAGEAILDGAGAVERNAHEAVEQLVHAHSRLVYRIAYAVLRRHHEAEDATQETFLRVLRYSSKLAAVEDPKTWLASIAWRVAVDRSRRNGHAAEIPLVGPDKTVPEVVSSETPADQTIQETQVGALIGRLIAGLPEKLRAPLLLSAIEEMTPREVAAALNINEAAVRSRVFRARQMLKEKLAQRLNRK
jgi:RNA polymerase sigma-70 factor, ECF subfamily